MGGFRLQGKDEETINNIVKETRNVPIHHIAPSRYFEELAMNLFKRACQDRYIVVGTG